jgi:hypothetical protein
VRKKLTKPVYPNNEYNYRTQLYVAKMGSGKSTMMHRMVKLLSTPES